jgi:hypothetical protein
MLSLFDILPNVPSRRYGPLPADLDRKGAGPGEGQADKAGLSDRQALQRGHFRLNSFPALI